MHTRLSLGACLVFLGGCINPSCDFHTGCVDDYECADNEVCEGVFTGKCEVVQRCETQACPAGSECTQRPDVPAANPFESDQPGKLVCDCYGSFDCGSGGSGAGGAGATGGGGYGTGATGGGGATGGAPSCMNGPPTGEVVSAEGFGLGDEVGAAMIAPRSTVSPGTVMVVPFKGNIDLGSGPLTSNGDTDVAIGERDDLGFPVWSASLGNAGADLPTTVGALADSAVVALGFTGSLVVAGQTLDGGPGAAAAVVTVKDEKIKFPVLLRSSGTVTVSALTDGTGVYDLTIAGTFSGTLDIGAISLTSTGGTDGFVVVLERKSSSVQWFYQLGGAGDQEITAAARGADGRIFVGGSFVGDTVVSGQTTTSNGRDGLVVMLDTFGEQVSHRVIGGPDRQSVNAMVLDEKGAVLATGVRASESQSAGSIDFGGGIVLDGAGLVDMWVAKLENDLSDVASATVLPGAPGTGEIIPRAMAYDCAGEILIAGQATAGASIAAEPVDGYGKYDAFVCKMDSAGVLWGKRFGGAEDDLATSVLPIGGDSILVGGSFAGAASFGAMQLTSAGGPDAFVVTLKP